MRLEPHRLVFIDETATATKMTRLRGRCPKGQRLRSKAPFGHLEDAVLHRRAAVSWAHRPFRPRHADEPAYLRNLCRTQLAPTLAKGDVVILDNLPAHRSPAADKAIRAKGAMAALPAASTARPQPIEMPSPSQAHLRAKAIRTIDALRQGIGDICTLFSPQNAENTSPPQDTDSNEHPPL